MKPTILLAAAILLTLGASAPVRAQGGPTLTDLEATRSDCHKLVDGLESVRSDLAALNSDSALNAGIDGLGETLDRARSLIDSLDTGQLAELHHRVALHPELLEIPQRMTSMLNEATQRARAAHQRLPAGDPIALPADPGTCGSDPGGQSSNCPQNTLDTDLCPSNPLWIRDLYIAQGVDLVAEELWSPQPETLETCVIGVMFSYPNPLRVIFAIIHFAAKEASLILEGIYYLNDECEGNYNRRATAYFVDETLSSRASADSVAALTRGIIEAKEEALRLDIESNLVSREGRTAVALYQLPDGKVCRNESSVACTTDANCRVCNEVTSKVCENGTTDCTADASVCTGIGDGSCQDVLIPCTTDTDCPGIPSRARCLDHGLCAHRGLTLVRMIVESAILDVRAAGEVVNARADRLLEVGDSYLGRGRHKEAYNAYRGAYRTALQVTR